MPNQNEQDLHIITNLLKKIQLFEGLDEQLQAEIIKHINLEYYPENFVLFREGDIGDKMYIIKSGNVRIFHAGETPSFDREIALLGENEFFGEMALISDVPRNATARTTQTTETFTLKKVDFLNLISTDPSFAAQVSKEFLDRVKANIREKNA